MTNDDVCTTITQDSAIWLTGLTSLAAQVVRMGVRDLFTTYTTSTQARTECYWATRGAVWGVGRDQEEWVRGFRNTSCD